MCMEFFVPPFTFLMDCPWDESIADHDERQVIQINFEKSTIWHKFWTILEQMSGQRKSIRMMPQVIIILLTSVDEGPGCNDFYHLQTFKV